MVPVTIILVNCYEFLYQFHCIVLIGFVLLYYTTFKKKKIIALVGSRL